MKAASPLTYINPSDPPIMILRGASGQLVPHNHGKQFYMALNKACEEAIFISLPKALPGDWNAFLTKHSLRGAEAIRSPSTDCNAVNPLPYTPTWPALSEFLSKHIKK